MIQLRSLVFGLLLALASPLAAFAQCSGQAPANTYCGNPTGALALPGWKSFSSVPFPTIAGGTVVGNRGTTATTASALTNPILGIPGTSSGQIGFAGSASGTVTIAPQATAGTATLTLPNTSGTFAVNATTPLVLSATTGALTCPTCVTSSGGGAITGTAPISVSAAGVVSINAPYTTLTASNGGIVYSGATNLAILAGTATAGQMLRSGASTAPAWSTATWPATTTINQLLYSSAANVVAGLATTSGGLLNTSSTSVPSITSTPVLGVAGTAVGSLGFQNLTSGTVTLTPVTGALGTVTINIPAAAGTMAVSATAPITLSAAGAIGVTSAALTEADDTNVTLTLGGSPSTALLAATSITAGWNGQLAVGRGGTGLASGTSGGIPYFSSTTTMASSAALATNQIVRGGGAGASPVGITCGTTTTVLHGGSPPSCGQVVYADISATAIANAANYFSGASSVLIPGDQIYQGEVTVTYGSTTTIDFNLLINGVVTLTGDISTLTLTNVKAGKAGQIRFIQDGSGNHVWPAGGNTVLKYAGGVLPALSTAANAVDVLAYSCSSATFCTASLLKDVRNP